VSSQLLRAGCVVVGSHRRQNAEREGRRAHHFAGGDQEEEIIDNEEDDDKDHDSRRSPQEREKALKLSLHPPQQLSSLEGVIIFYSFIFLL
jgi:hypothetical protein